jgi:hypothetical protein
VNSRPEAAIPAWSVFPAVLVLSDACPCPFIAIEGIQNHLGFEAAGSKSIPDWTRDGVVSRSPSWYQRAAARLPVALATPEELTRML